MRGWKLDGYDDNYGINVDIHLIKVCSTYSKILWNRYQARRVNASLTNSFSINPAAAVWTPAQIYILMY